MTEIDADGVQTASGQFFPSDLTVWAAGIMAPEVQRHLDGLEVNRANQLVVGPTLQTTHDPAIFAFGDCAAAPWLGQKEGAILPPRAQVAHQQATLLSSRSRRASPGSRCRISTSATSARSSRSASCRRWAR